MGQPVPTANAGNVGKRNFRRLALVCTSIAVLVAAGLLFLQLKKPQRAEGAGPPGTHPAVQDPDSSAVTVNTIHPRRDPSFAMTVSEPAYVEAYYTSELKSRVAGPVKDIHAELGARVKLGEALIEIDAPDLIQAVEQARAAVVQRQKEEILAQKKAQVAAAAVKIALVGITLARAMVADKEATCAMRHSRWARYKGMLEVKGVPEAQVEEEERDYLAAKSECEAARAGVDKAVAQWEDARANLEAANADVTLKDALVEAARKDQEHAQALADYTRLTAPYDGVVTRRTVDPGSYVILGSAASEPLLTVERDDIVTIYMKVPDNFAPYVTADTDAIIEMSELPGQLIHGKVTRFPPSLITPQGDRTMRVEVDLYNGRQYERFLAREKARPEPFSDLKTGLNRGPYGNYAIPVPPKVTVKSSDTEVQPPRLLPGMIGRMTLVLHKFNDAFLIPTDAIIRQGGPAYVYVIKNGTARLVPVEVQADDMKLAKVTLVTRRGGEVVHEELTGQEEIVISNQSELADGQAVKTNHVDW
jgi:multidrug efflux pump subunit AcrA (membrane-fusion protein)